MRYLSYILFILLLTTSCASFKKQEIEKHSVFNYQEEILQKEASLYKSYLFYANTLFREGGEKYIPEIEKVLEKAVILNVNDTKALLTLINIYQRQKDAKDKLVHLCRNVVLLDEISIKTAIIIGFLFYDLEHKEDAAKMFYKIGLEQKDSSEIPYYFASYVLKYNKLNEENYKKLLFANLNFVKAAPQNDYANVILGETYHILKENEKAIEYFEKIKPISKTYEIAVITISKIYALKQKHNIAILKLKEAIKNFPANKKFYDKLIDIYDSIGEYENIVSTIDQAIKNGINEITLSWELASTHYKMGNKEKALKVMEDSLLKKPNNGYIKNMVAYFYAEKGIELGKAEKLINEALYLNKGKSKESKAHYLDTLAWIYFKRGKLKEAKAILIEADTIAPNEIIILEHMGDVCYKLGESDVALLMYKKAIKHAPNNSRDKKRLQNKIEKKFIAKTDKE